jgi:hypothetical protein
VGESRAWEGSTGTEREVVLGAVRLYVSEWAVQLRPVARAAGGVPADVGSNPTSRIMNIAELAVRMSGVAQRLGNLPGDIRVIPVGGRLVLEFEGTLLGVINPNEMVLVIHGHENDKSGNGHDESIQHHRGGDGSEV